MNHGLVWRARPGGGCGSELSHGPRGNSDPGAPTNAIRFEVGITRVAESRVFRHIQLGRPATVHHRLTMATSRERNTIQTLYFFLGKWHESRRHSHGHADERAVSARAALRQLILSHQQANRVGEKKSEIFQPVLVLLDADERLAKSSRSDGLTGRKKNQAGWCRWCCQEKDDVQLIHGPDSAITFACESCAWDNNL